MNRSSVWTPEALEWLKKNCTMTAEAMQDILTEKFGVQPALQTIRDQLGKARKEARLESDAVAAEVDRMIQEKVRASCDEYWDILDGVIKREAKILDGTDPEYRCQWKDGSPSLREWRSTAKTLGEHIQIAFSIRPEPREIDITIETNRDVEALLKEYSEVYEKE